jgi:hypothetical protein
LKKEHINVWRAWLVWSLGLLLAIIGTVNVVWQLLVPSYFFSFQYLLVGGVLLIVGFTIIIINWMVFNVRKTQLDVDYKEGIRDRIGNFCPKCGQRLQQGSRFCNNCGNSLV